MTPAEAYAKLIAMEEEELNGKMNGRVILRHILDTIEGAIEREDLPYLQEFIGMSKSEDIGPRYACAILHYAFRKRRDIARTWYDLRENCWNYMIKLDKPGRLRLMRALMRDEDGRPESYIAELSADQDHSRCQDPGDCGRT